MTKPFNWHYKTAHKLGRSRVADAKSEAYATFTAKPCDLDEPIVPRRELAKACSRKAKAVRRGA